MILIPTHCPSCGSEIERINDQLFCRNPTCGDKLAKVVRGYAAKTKIKGLGDKTIEKLGLTSIQSIYDLTEEVILDIIGKALGVKLVREIEKAKNLDLGIFLSACSINLIGSTAGRKVATLTNNPEEINKELCKKAGLGEKATTSLTDWLSTAYVNMDLPIQFNEVVQEKKIEATMKVCITGRLNGYTKASATELLNTYNVQVVTTVNQADVLLLNERKGSAKEKQAEKLNKSILTMDELLLKLENIK